MTQKFVVQLAQPLSGEEYSAAGENGSMLRVGEIATQVLKNVRGGALFAYLFRRFGYPNTGWDERKNLVSYLLTTPKPNTFLMVTPYMGSDSPETSYDSTGLMFGYTVSQYVEETFLTCISKGGHKSWDKHPLHQELNKAFEQAIHDLLRPVFIRDVPINCYGRVLDENVETLPQKIERTPMAGYPIPGEFFSNVERWEKFCDAIEILGQGNFEKGMESVLKTAETVKLYN